MYTLAVYDESSSYQFSYLNRTDNTNYKRCFQKGIPLIPIQPRRKTAKPRYGIFLKIQKYRKDHPSNSHFEWIETSCIIANFHLPGCTYFPWRARRTFIRVLVPWMKVRGVLGSVPSLELRVHTRVKDTFVLHAAVWLRRRLRHVLSWQSVQLATNAFPRGQTDQAGQLRSPLRTRLLPLSLSPFRPLGCLPSTRLLSRSSSLLFSLFPSLSYFSFFSLPFLSVPFHLRFIPFHVVSRRLLTLVQQRFYAAHLPCNSNGSTG